MEDEDLLCCISCMSRNELFDLFAEDSENENNYGKVFETCFGLKIDDNLKKYICKKCIETLEIAATFKKQTQNTLSIINSIKDEEEYLDENILEEENRGDDADWTLESEDLDDKRGIRTLDETRCIFCGLQLPSAEDARAHMRAAHTGETLCGADDPEDNQCQKIKMELESRKYACHFCENVYSSRKACFTHLRMKHGLKCIVDQTKKNVERKKCPMCTRDFSQKQVLNKHLWKTHGLEVEKRKAFICPLCDERVSYGSNFSAHLLHTHKVCEQVEQLEFYTMDDFLLFKSAIQEETKYRFRKTTASKQTIEGIRSHYMCSQSGVYVYQGKGKRSAPDRQIYKTGKACPAHMIVTETLDRVLVTFYKTHVGHGPCPYYEPREPKKAKREILAENEVSEEAGEDCQAWICDACGLQFSNGTQFNIHVASHGLNRFPCQYCGEDFRDMDAWTDHVQAQHSQNAANCYQYSNYIVM